MSKKDQTRITVFLDAELVRAFNQLTNHIGISGTALLNQTLPRELDYLAKLPTNTEKALRFLRSAPVRRKNRFNITLDRATADRLRQLCQRKRVPRDRFISLYIRYLVDGPLKKISEIRSNPRHEYSGSQPYSELHMTDQRVDELRKLIRELYGEGGES